MPSAHAYFSLGILLGLLPHVRPQADLNMLPPCGEANELKLGSLTGFPLPNQCGALSIPRHTWSSCVSFRGRELSREVPSGPDFSSLGFK